MKTVKEILKDKGALVCSISEEATMHEALQVMADRNIGALIVKTGERIIGIVSERDYARASVRLCKSPLDCYVRDVMTTKVLALTPDRTIEECMSLMTDKRVRHLPVLEGGNLVGIVSIGDVVKALIEEKTFMINQLESYITEGR